jgi:zinc transport system permease protein
MLTTMNTDLLSLFQTPFMVRAMIAGILLASVTSVVGVFAVLRRSSFLGDALSHSALFGVAIGILLGIHPVFTASLVVISVALSLPSFTKKSGIPIDNIFGFLLPFSMALGVIVLAFVPGYQPDLMSFLFGSILSVSWMDIGIAGLFAIFVFVVLARYFRRLLSVSFDPSYATLTGISVSRMDIVYHVLLAMSVIIGLRLVGTILINALLIIPASTVRMYARSVKDMFIWTPILAVCSMVIGIIVSALFNVPTGPSIVFVSGAVFLFAVGAKRL